jgi:hypothetical protein
MTTALHPSLLASYLACSLLQRKGTSTSISWPFHLGRTCFWITWVILTSSCYRIGYELVSYDFNLCKPIIYDSSIKLWWLWLEGQYALLSFEESPTLAAWPQEYNQLTFSFSDDWILVPKVLQWFPLWFEGHTLLAVVLFLVLWIWFYGLWILTFSFCRGMCASQQLPSFVFLKWTIT